MTKILWLLVWAAQNTWALSGDALQPIMVEADKVIIDEKKGISTYSGDATVRQGTLMLSAQRIELFMLNRSLNKVIAHGSKQERAQYKQNQPNQPRFVEATATNIVYLVKKNFVYLKGNARLTQGFDSFSGEEIDYDIENDKVIAKQSEDGTRRVRFKIKL